MDGKGSIWGIILIIVLVALGIWWLSSNRTGTTTDELETVLNNLQETTALAFSDVQVVEFEWMYEGEDRAVERMSVTGKGFEVIEISSDQQREIEDYFEAQGFENDLYNAAAGVAGSLAGYKKDDLVCQIESGVTGGEEGLEAENVTYDVKVRCAKAEVPEAKGDEELIAEAFAAKYDKPVEDVTVTISERIKVFATGGVKLSKDPEATGGLFFAVQQEGQWVIAWDGNGIVDCASIDKYDFPTEIVSACVDEQGDLKQR